MPFPDVMHLLAVGRLPEDLDRLARRYAPILRFDALEPFFPSAAGVTVFDRPAPSPSFPREIPFDEDTARVIEYAIWWDWDIQHLYELEHIWVFIAWDGSICRVDASWHGDYHTMLDEDRIPMENGRPMVWSEPGKHAFAPSPRVLEARRERTIRSCGRWAGAAGVLETALFRGRIPARSPQADRLVHTWLERRAFVPRFEFIQRFDLRWIPLVRWEALENWIPQRVAGWIAQLDQDIPPHERRFLRVGHRGASAYAPENTLTAFRRAIELGADAVELDVRLSADGVPVVIHDAELLQSGGNKRRVRDLTVGELQSVDVGGGEHIPTLAEVIDALRGEVALYIELKDENTPAAVLDVLREKDYLGWCFLGSFRPDLVAEVKRLEPNARTAILFKDVTVDPVSLARSCQADYVHPCWERASDHPSAFLSPEWVQRVRDAGLGLIIWHEERPEEIAALRRLGVDAICSDRPDLLRESAPEELAGEVA
ncbi:MAG: hypothetical protein Kow0047_28700 [Anaerolineae bacterium]